MTASPMATAACIGPANSRNASLAPDTCSHEAVQLSESAAGPSGIGRCLNTTGTGSDQKIAGSKVCSAGGGAGDRDAAAEHGDGRLGRA